MTGTKQRRTWLLPVAGGALLLWNAGSVGQSFVAGGRARLGLQSPVGAKVARNAFSGLEVDAAVDTLLLADAGPLDFLPAILGVLALGAAGAAAYGWNLFQGPRGESRTDGYTDEQLPPWADNAAVLSDTLSGKPFDEVLLNMRARHGDAFRIFVPSLFGEVVCLMGLEANQWIFNEKDKVLDQALGGVVGTAVSGKKTMGTKERKSTESGKIFDKASTAFFSNKKALARATRIFLDSAEDFCDQMERELKPDENVFEKLWTYVVQTNADMLYGEGDNAGRIVCRTISSINKEGLFSPAVRAAGDDLRVVLDKSYAERVAEPEKFEDEDSLFEEFFKLSKGEADEEMLQGLQQFMLTLQLAANGNQLVTIRWLMSHVYADPAILAGVRDEVKALLASKGPGVGIRDLNLQDLLDLSLTNACITEAVRLHSDIPSKLTLRSAEEDMEFKGWKIPKGMTIFLYADATHKDSKLFGPDPGAFCPQRYMNPEEWTRMQMDKEIVTFGHGRKRCTGELHARAQICALMASFALRFDMDLKTEMPGDLMPEDHDGPFVFDAANTLLLVNLRKQKILEGAEKVPVESAASLFGQRALAEQKAQLSPPVEGEEVAAEGPKAPCPFGFDKIFPKSEESA